jgi:hypothetical protein
MSLAQINWHPSRRELRTFALVALIAAILVAVLLCRLKGLGIQWGAGIVSLGAAILLSSFISLRFTRLIYLGLMIATLPLGLLVSFLLLAAFYFGILTPLALLFRLTGRDPLHRQFDRDAESYWIAHRKPDNLDRYYNQF